VIAVEPTNVGFPHVQTVIKVRRKSSAAAKGQGPEIRYYVSSIPVQTYTAKRWLNLIRGHWGGIEIRNHWRKDACLFEDKTRSRNPKLVATLAMLRNALLFFFSEQQIHSTLTGFVESVAADPSKAYSMLTARS
jgi:predicted transposase YbfD/YdcC